MQIKVPEKNKVVISFFNCIQILPHGAPTVKESKEKPQVKDFKVRILEQGV